MCLIRGAIQHSLSRRNFIRAAGTLAAAPLVLRAGAPALGAPAPRARTVTRAGDGGTRLVLLGTAGGPTWWPPNPGDPDRDPGWDAFRASASSALLVGDAMYLIDLGHGAAHRLGQAFSSGEFVDGVERGYPTFLENLRAIFFTHLHMDHTADFPSILLCGYGAGLGKIKDPQTGEPRPVKVIGPGNRGQVEEDLYDLHVPLMNPRNPTPGTNEMTHYLWQAYAQSINDFTRDNGWPDFASLFDVEDIDLPRRLPRFISPNKTPCPAMAPFHVYRDENIRVQATLVDHHQVFPSFAFRFDTPGGSVAFSGDTGPDTKGNLQRLAYRADILVHEVIDQAWITNTFGEDPQDPQTKALVTHLKTAHTTIEDVGKAAEAARVGTLVLSHIVPGNTPMAHLRSVKDFTGTLIVGEDLMEIPVG